MSQETIELTDTFQTAAIKMAQGTPGAIRVLAQIMRDAPAIDPDNAMGGFGIILNMDSVGIRGSKIWMLYKDVCSENITNLCAVMRGWQLGLVSESAIMHAIENRGDGISVSDILSEVKDSLPSFGNFLQSESER